MAFFVEIVLFVTFFSCVFPVDFVFLSVIFSSKEDKNYQLLANLKSPFVKYLISFIQYLTAANLFTHIQNAKPVHHSSGLIHAFLKTSG
jgi:hypothetical protein